MHLWYNNENFFRIIEFFGAVLNCPPSVSQLVFHRTWLYPDFDRKSGNGIIVNRIWRRKYLACATLSPQEDWFIFLCLLNFDEPSSRSLHIFLIFFLPFYNCFSSISIEIWTFNLEWLITDSEGRILLHIKLECYVKIFEYSTDIPEGYFLLLLINHDRKYNGGRMSSFFFIY